MHLNKRSPEEAEGPPPLFSSLYSGSYDIQVLLVN